MFAHLAACFDYSTINMTLLDKILVAPDNARISILYPCTEGRGGEHIGDVVELKREIEALRVPLTPTEQLMTDLFVDNETRPRCATITGLTASGLDNDGIFSTSKSVL